MNNKYKMKTRFDKFRFKAVVCMVVSCSLLLSFFLSNNTERDRFRSFNRSSVPNDDLEQIMSPTSIALSFDKFYHLDAIHWRDKYGKRVLSVSTKCLNLHVMSNLEEVDTGYITVDNYGMECPYSFPMDDSTVYKMRAMELLAGCNYDFWRKVYVPVDETLFNYYEWGLPNVFYESVYKPLLRKLFGHLLYVRAQSPQSIIKAVRLNEVGRISSVYLYNGDVLYFDNPFDSVSQQRYKDLFQTSMNENCQEELVKSYEKRLGYNSLRSFHDEAELLAMKHTEEIKRTFLEEDLDLLGSERDGFSPIVWKDSKRTAYPNWISCLLGLGLLFGGLALIFVIRAYKTGNRE